MRNEVGVAADDKIMGERSIIEDPEVASKTPTLDLFLLLAARKRLIAVVTAGAMAIAVVFTLFMKPIYTASATILPPQTPQSSLSSMLGQLGSLSGLGGSGGLLKNPADMYIGILQGRTVSDRVIDHFHLQQRWKLKNMTPTRLTLAETAQFESSKDGMIRLSFKDHDPQFASDVTNFYVDALYDVNSSLAITEAAQRRLFFEKQLDEEKAALSAAEEDLKKTQQKTGILTIAGQTELAVRNVAQIRAEISAHEVELQGLRTYAAENNPDVTRIAHELQTLRTQLAAQEENQKNTAIGDTEISTSQVPVGGLEYARKFREVKYHETLFDLLSRQYEAARIDEAKSAPIIQVVDRAVPPDQKSGPHRTLIVVGMGLVGFFLSCAWIMLQGALSRAKQQPVLAEKLQLLHSFFPWLPL
ncbi:GumC family protein [Terriglobus roseus]|uniref:Uncharacterized protein involved in exopolysaccharide biosynthesis n=1 Tax=Terriglobus roseus TaxID=392734 RepID=A0A1G7NE67_9BACT|nr:Wzz/FepE/Etk N-terminal domain-containing protein [Terriglobus roseus]SDF71619.1 Uncharacterized protein involved in exopolysaccharide biosynthesis [Terriglobus roseus]